MDLRRLPLPPRAMLALPLVIFALCAAPPSWSRGKPETPMTRTEVGLLGTTCTVTIYKGWSEAAFDEVFARLAQIEDRMTVIRNDSEVLQVNRSAGRSPVRVSPDTFFVIQRALEMARLGGGAFDITVGPLVRLWGIGTAAARVPSPREIAAAMAKVGWQKVVLSPGDSTVFLTQAGMALDLGAIAKGYAADEAARILRERGASSALVNLGGNVLTVGKKPDGSPWRIGVQNPEEPRGTHVGIVEVGESAVVTSGSYERFFESGGRRYHHILDTKAGAPVSNGLSAVMIVTADSMSADAWSTLIFALGLDKGRALVESSRGAVEALFVTEGRDIHVTAGLKPRFKLTDTRFTLED